MNVNGIPNDINFEKSFFKFDTQGKPITQPKIEIQTNNSFMDKLRNVTESEHFVVEEIDTQPVQNMPFLEDIPLSETIKVKVSHCVQCKQIVYQNKTKYICLICMKQLSDYICENCEQTHSKEHLMFKINSEKAENDCKSLLEKIKM